MSNLKLRANVTDYRSARIMYEGLRVKHHRTKLVTFENEYGMKGLGVVLGYQTWLVRWPTGGRPIYTVRHFDTDIVTYYTDGDIRLSYFPGHERVSDTTANRMSLCTPSNISVGADKGKTYVCLNADDYPEPRKRRPFEHNMIIDRTEHKGKRF